MKAYEIPGWLDGVKIRRKCWLKHVYMNFENGRWVSKNKLNPCDSVILSLWKEEDWEVYEEPKPTYRDVVQYRGIYKRFSNHQVIATQWSTIEPLNNTCDHDLLGVEQRTIRIHDDGRVEVIG